MSGSITDLSSGTPPARIDAEICIIGSGCAGATAAWTLAEAGRDVVVLEEGGDYTGRRLTQRDGEMYDQLYMDRGGRSTEDLAVSVLQGRVLGGGGVINASDVVPIPQGVLHHWVKRFGLTTMAPEALAPYTLRALADLSAKPIAEAQVNKANALLRKGAEALGLRGELMMHNRGGCIGLGTCLIGCPVSAKSDPRSVAVPRAQDAGARFYTRARAVRIDGAAGEVKTVMVRTLDPRGYREVGETEVRAKVVIVAANAVASPQLLLRSGIDNNNVGRQLSLQPQLAVVARFAEVVDAFRGIPQAYVVTHGEIEDHPDHGLWGYRLEPIMGTPGIVSSLLPWAGHEGKQAMAAFRHLAAALVLVPDRPTGSVGLTGAGRPLIRYTHADDHKARLREGAKLAARSYLAAGAEEVIIPTHRPVRIRSERDLAAIDALGFEPTTAPLISAHQQASIPMAPSAGQGGVDPDGQVYGTRGVYVFDSSIFPSSSSSHTMTPILTVSRYLADRLLAAS